MEISLDTIVALLGLFIGGGGGAFFTWRYQKKKAAAEAIGADASAAKELQDVYQQLITDIKTDRDEQKAYISELKDDRRHLREERDDLRKRQDELEELVRKLQQEVNRNSLMVESMRPLLCGRAGTCKLREPATILDTVDAETLVKPKPKAKKQ